MPLLNVDITVIGLSEHRLLCWSSRLLRPPPVYSTSTRRSWRSFDLGTFHADLRMSALCHLHQQLINQQWIGLDGDGLTSLYDDVVVALLDLEVPLRTTTCRRRPSNA